MSNEVVYAVLGSGALTALVTGVFGIISSNKKTRTTIVDKLDVIEKKTDANAEQILELKFENCKTQILDFANAIMNGKVYSPDQFTHILGVIDIYERDYATKHNGEIKQSIGLIHKEHLSSMEIKRKKNISKTLNKKESEQ